MGINFHIVDFSAVHKVDEDLVGKKAHELGMLWKLGISIPNGFVITTQFFKDFLRQTGIDKEIKKTQALKHPALSDSNDKLFLPIQKKIMHSHIPQALTSELHKYYRQLSGIFKNRALNVFSSSPNNKSIVFFNVKGDANIILKIKAIWSMSPENSVAIVVQENIKVETKGKIATNNPLADKKLANYCKIIQKHFYFPKEIEYIVSKGKIFITRVTPFTPHPTPRSSERGSTPCSRSEVSKCPDRKVVGAGFTGTFNKDTQKTLIRGTPINPGIATGTVKILQNKYGTLDAKNGDVVILKNLDHSLFNNIKNAKALIVDSAFSNSFEKALFREYFKIPAIQETKDAIKTFHDGNVVTVNGMSGEIYSGGLVY